MVGLKTLIHRSTRSTVWRVDGIPGLPAFVSKEFRRDSDENRNEIVIHEKLSHIPGVVKGFGSPYEGKSRLLTEYCEKNSIRSFFEESKEPVSEADLLSMYRQMTTTLQLVHEEKVAHRAISAENWLLTADIQVKLTDFGHARLLSISEPITDIAGSSEKSFHLLFAEDALRLSKVFYQMATCDFNAQVLNLPGSAVKAACAERKYSPLVSNAICHLLRFRCRPLDPDAHQAYQAPQDPGISFEDLEELPEPNNRLCTFCCIRPARPIVFCEHWICDTCERYYRSLGILGCPICSTTGNASLRSILVPAAGYPFFSIDFSQLEVKDNEFSGIDFSRLS